MTAGLQIFARVRALRDSPDSPGEKVAAFDWMEALAHSAGMMTEPATLQIGQCPSTRAERRAAALSLIAEGHADREIARRLGISPTTVGALRRTLP